MKSKKIRLTDKDLYIIDAYSKKNLSDTIPQFRGSSEKQPRPVHEMVAFRDEK